MTAGLLLDQLSELSRSDNAGASHAAVYGLLAQLHRSLEAGHEADRARARQLMFDFHDVECGWSLFLGSALWRNVGGGPAEFTNIWNFARFSGTPGKTSRLDPAVHLAIASSALGGSSSAARYILIGNLLRLSHRYGAAEDSYLEGIARNPGDPFLKFRLADLYLATYRAAQAEALLRQLKANYPYAREMMFLDPPTLPAMPTMFGELACGVVPLVCMVAADPVYVDRYAARYASSLRTQASAPVHLHLHVISDSAAPPDDEIFTRVGPALQGATLTHRALQFGQANDNWRKAVYACERFLILAELLEKYQRPVLVSDIDVVVQRDPLALLAALDGYDLGYTTFRNTNEAWERYAATVLLVQPSARAIDFFRRAVSLVLGILRSHPQPWFVDQIVLFRLIEAAYADCRVRYLENILGEIDTPGNTAWFGILHGSWQAVNHNTSNQQQEAANA